MIVNVALLKEHKNEIDARAPTFVEFNKFAGELVANSHPQSADIVLKRNDLNQLCQELDRKWHAREVQLNQCLALILFERDCHAADRWMFARELSLKSESTGTSVEDAFKKYEDLDRAINMHEEKIARLQYTANELIEYDHYAKSEVKARIEGVLERWKKLKQVLLESRLGLDETQTVERFLLDAREMEEWLDEKKEAVEALSQAVYIDTGDILVKKDIKLNFTKKCCL